jgi:type I restriction enzyme, S subunit
MVQISATTSRRRSIFSRSNIGPVGLYWIGYAPTDWIVTTLQRLFAVNSGDFLSPGDLQNDGFPVFGGNGFRGYFREKNCDSGTMLIGRYGALCGNVHIPTEPFWATEHAFRVRPLIEYHQPFVARYVEALELRYLATRAAQPGLNSRMVREQAIALPDIPTQKRIAAFLDRETARIDDLIAKKERLVAVLREGLLSELERLVTPDTPIHDQMIPFRWVCRITEGQC